MTDIVRAKCSGLGRTSPTSDLETECFLANLLYLVGLPSGS